MIDACDFVVTVSNTTAHIAGAIGKQTYLMLPKGKGKTMVLVKGKMTKVYGTNQSKIMEQKEIGQWNEVIDQLCAQKVRGMKIENYNRAKKIMLSVENNLRKAKKYSDNAKNQYIPKYLLEKFYNLLNFKKYDELIYEALKLRSNFPSCSNLTSILGSAYFKINNFDEAIVYFKRSINLQNNNLDNYYNAGLTLMKLKKSNKQINIFVM